MPILDITSPLNILVNIKPGFSIEEDVLVKRILANVFRRKVDTAVAPIADGPRRLALSDEELRQFHRPQALRWFAIGNLVVAVFYSLLGTIGIVSIMFFDGAISERVTFSNMIELLQRSLLHSMGAGIALVVDHIMHGTGEILKGRTTKPVSTTPALPKSDPSEP